MVLRIARPVLQAKFAVRRLPAALPLRQCCFFGGQVNRRPREDFVDVAAHDAATVCPVPVSLDDDRAAALGTVLRGGFLKGGHGDNFSLA